MADAAIDRTHDIAAKCWVPGAGDHPNFPVQNLPLGIFEPAGGSPRAVMAIGDRALDLSALARLPGSRIAEFASDLAQASLNALAARGPAALTAVRAQAFDFLTDPAQAQNASILLDPSTGKMLRPFAIGDYTDFFSGIQHAINAGSQFRPENPLLPNYKYVPIGYHGRASSVRVSPSDVIRPTGQTKPADLTEPLWGASKRLDYEMEMAVWVGPGNALGEPIPVSEASAHIAGYGILNDWSARDIQAWEYVPLGPFLAKNFHSTVSPWVVTQDALAPFRTAQPPRPEGDPAPLPYLTDEADQQVGALAVTMEVHLLTAQMADAGDKPHRLSSGPMTAMYWTAAQLVAHHTSNGCDLNPGDLLGTGTLSGEPESSWGSLLELSRGAKQAIELPNGETRRFLEDGDTVIMTAFAEREGYARIGFGEARGTIRPARVTFR